MKLLDETASDFGIMLLNVGHSWGEIQITRPQHCTVCEGKGRGLLFSCPESVVFGWRQNVDKKLIPKTECLKDTVSRVVPFWQNSIVPEIKVRRTMSMHGGGPLSPHKVSEAYLPLFIPFCLPSPITLSKSCDSPCGDIALDRLSPRETLKTGTNRTSDPNQRTRRCLDPNWLTRRGIFWKSCH